VRSTATSAEVQVAPQPEDAAAPVKIEAGGKAKITITVEVDGRGHPAEVKVQPVPEALAVQADHWVVIPPAESATVFVDFTAYNSKNFYVQGDVQTVGKFPWTGNETVLDALQHAGGLMASAEPKDIRLVRPGRNGRPSRVYKVDLEAIQEQGDVATNYQMFPGDRLIIGRNALVKKTTEIDRIAAALQTVTGSNLQYAFMLRSLQLAAGDSRDEMLKELVDFWAKELSRDGDLKLDEQALRNALIRKLKFAPAPITPDGK
ncbi:MAG TPA: SLBB domain-containing protein, partial [Isosphaeraceae bacterium]|nr:SLBB domain-containing protein [Isosphaeraceae bacterium]